MKADGLNKWAKEAKVKMRQEFSWAEGKAKVCADPAEGGGASGGGAGGGEEAGGR